jgi:hypothetical protein
LNKGRDGMGMKSDGVVMKGKGDGVPPKLKSFSILGKIENGKGVGHKKKEKRLSDFPDTNLEYSMNLIKNRNKKHTCTYLRSP